jgi:CheY-like chemotaxis protein
MPNKVLIVDDDPALCEFIQEVLVSEKIQPHIAMDSTQAAARLQNERFDAVFLDMRMPSLDGVELTKRIRSSGPNQSTPLVMITGDSDQKVMQHAFQAGVNLFLFKPVDRSRLMRLLNAADNFIASRRVRFTRIKTIKDVSIESGERRITGTSLDLSVGGMFVRSSATFPVGSTVNVGLELQAGKPPIQLSARVVRVCGNDCMGLQIETAGDEETRRLENFLLPFIRGENDPKSLDIRKPESSKSVASRP